MRVITLFIATALALLCADGRGAAQAPAAPPTDKCVQAMSNASVDGAAKVGGEQSAEQPPIVSLGDTIVVNIVGLAELKRDCTARPIVLFLNSYPIKSLKAFPPSAPAAEGTGELKFVLAVTEDSKASWTPILGRPCCAAREIELSVGVEDQFPLRATAGKTLPRFKLDILGNKWFVIWLAIFIIMLIIFVFCVWRTNIIRNGNPSATADGRRGTFSLSKSQGALWFFVILAAYLLIGIATGDFANTINSTAVILLGIGAGTVIGSTVIDVSRARQEAGEAAAEGAAIQAKIDQLEPQIKAIDAQLDAYPPPPPQTVRELVEARRIRQAEKNFLISQYRKLTGQTENFMTDILSDADGVSFHRFQMAAWTIVLAIIFIKGVYENLAMPEFSTTLMGLLGLSAGTYLGLKIPEAKTPTR